MTNKIEKQFFDTFGISKLCCKKYITNCTRYGECEECVNYDKDFSTYPQITDRILLELIRIIGLITIKYTNEQCEICYSDGAISYLGKDLKAAILNFLISKVSIFKQQVRTLFEEEQQ